MSSEKLTARLIRWNSEKGYGFLRVGAHDVFLHVKDMTVRQREPELGDVFEFSLGGDFWGRRCARQAVYLDPLNPEKPSNSQRPVPMPRPSRPSYQPRHQGKFSVGHTSLLFLLLLLPIAAALKLALPIGVFLLSASALSIITYLIYALDKVSAVNHRWRVAETTLHALSAIGGWPGAFVAQQRLRHKVSKPGFQITFWLIVVADQFTALDLLLDWKLSRAVIR